MLSRLRTVLNARNARWLAWVFAAINILLMGIGLALQLKSLSLWMKEQGSYTPGTGAEIPPSSNDQSD